MKGGEGGRTRDRENGGEREGGKEEERERWSTECENERDKERMTEMVRWDCSRQFRFSRTTIRC